MKQLANNYSISGSTVTLTGVNVPLSQILLVSDATTGSVLYSMAGPSASSYTQGANSTISLGTTPGASDKLTIYYDDGVAPANAPSSVSVSNLPATQPVSGTVSISGTVPVSGPMTDAQLRASAVPVSASALTNLDADVGATNDAAATSDTGTFSLIALTKRLLGKFSALTDGTQKSQIVNGANALAVDSSGAITANNGANQTYTYTTTSTVSAGTVVIGPLNCSQHRTLLLHIVASGSGSYSVQISNDGTNWANILAVLLTSQYGSGFYQATTGYGAGTIFSYATQGANYIRVSVNSTLSGTNTISASLSPQPQSAYAVYISDGPNSITPRNSPNPTPVLGFSNSHSLVCAATTNATLLRNSQAQIGSLILTNNSSTWAYFKFCNTATAPTPGTTTAVLNIGVAPNSTLDCSSSYAGLRLTTGLSYYVSAGTSLTDNTALPAAGTFLVNMTYV